MREDFGEPAHGDLEPYSADDFTSSSATESDLEPHCERDAWRVATAYTSATPTLFVVDYEPTDILFKDTSDKTVAALQHVSGGRLAARRLSLEEHAASWRDKLGEVHMFPAYVLATSGGVYRVYGSFMRKMYITHRVLE